MHSCHSISYLSGEQFHNITWKFLYLLAKVGWWLRNFPCSHRFLVILKLWFDRIWGVSKRIQHIRQLLEFHILITSWSKYVILRCIFCLFYIPWCEKKFNLVYLIGDIIRQIENKIDDVGAHFLHSVKDVEIGLFDDFIFQVNTGLNW